MSKEPHLVWDDAVQYGHTGKNRPGAADLRQAILWAHRRLQDYEGGNHRLLDDLHEAQALRGKYEAALLQLADPSRTFARADDVAEMARRLMGFVINRTTGADLPLQWCRTPLDDQMAELLAYLEVHSIITLHEVQEW